MKPSAFRPAGASSPPRGILVVDLDGKILSFNQKMADMWGIPPEIFASGDDQRAIGAALEKLVHPDDFMAKVMELYRHPEEASYDVLELKDGRTFERYSQPQRIDDVAVGRVWSFRDVTSRRRADEHSTALVREQRPGRSENSRSARDHRRGKSFLSACSTIRPLSPPVRLAGRRSRITALSTSWRRRQVRGVGGTRGPREISVAQPSRAFPALALSPRCTRY